MTDRKLVFDAFRTWLGRPLVQADVKAMDDFLDQVQGSAIPSIGARGVTLIKRFEGCHDRLPDGHIAAYPDPGTGGAPWTIGWGATEIDGRAVRPNEVITQERADEILLADLRKFSQGVKSALGSAPTTQAQFDAMVSLAYNIGVGALKSSTLLKKHKAGDYAGAQAEFPRWNKAGGRVLSGLVKRRAEEAKLYGERA